MVKSMIKAQIKHLNVFEKELESLTSTDARTSHYFFPRFEVVRNGEGSRAFYRLLAEKPTLRCFLEKCWKTTEDPICACGKEQEDVHHFVMRCERFDEYRQEWDEEMREMRGCLTKTDENYKKLYDFVCASKRFGQ